MTYIINMLPYILIGSVVYIALRCIKAMIKRERNFKWIHEVIVFTFVMYCIGLASQTIIPKFEFGNGSISIIGLPDKRINIIPFMVLYDVYQSIFEHNYLDYFIYNFLGNILLFVPLGAYLPLVFKDVNTLRKVMVSGFAISLAIELIQFPLHRGCDIDDLWLNILGVVMGFMLFRFFNRHYRRKK